MSGENQADTHDPQNLPAAPAPEPSADALQAVKREGPTLYDAEAKQMIHVEVIRGKRYPTKHTLAPCSDELYVEYDKLKNLRILVGADKSTATLSDREKASHATYQEIIEEVQGWGDPQGSNVDEQIARMVIEEGLFICAVDDDEDPPDLGDAEKDQPWLKPASSLPPISLRCRFNGEELVTKHYPRLQDEEGRRLPTAGQKKRYEELQAKRKVKGAGSLKASAVTLESIAKPLGKLYAELFERADGYKPGTRVPLWHRREVVAHYFEKEEGTVGES